MAATTPLITAIKNRRTIYTLSPDSPPIPDEKVTELVSLAITHVPSSYNVQSARAVLLFGAQHAKFWDIVERNVSAAVPPQVWEGFLKGAVAGHKRGRGTVMFFEDQVALEALAKKNPMVKPLVGEWSDVSSGMHQYVVWTALEAEGFGASLQHFNFSPQVVADVRETWKLPESWTLKAQLVFGTPTAGAGEKSFEPLETRVKVFS